MFFGISQEMMEAYSQGESWEDRNKEAKEKREQAAADAQKTDEEKFTDALASSKEAGSKLARRLLGIVDRETGKLTDQYTVLEGHEEEVSHIVMEAFRENLDNEFRERGLIDDEE